MIKPTKTIKIPQDQLTFIFSRSSGPGGQNVNKLNTRVTVFFDVANSPQLSETQKKRILTHLAGRANKKGVIRVVSQRHRTQKQNRTAAVEKLAMLLNQVLKTKRARKKTKVPKYAREKRLEEKKKRSILKQQRVKKYLNND